jgi:hypothetical protein
MAKEVNTDEKLVYTIKETAALLGLSVQGTYNAVWSGDLPSIRSGAVGWCRKCS